MLFLPGPCFFGIKRHVRAVLIMAVLGSSALTGVASGLLIYSSPGGPMQYNGFNGVWTDHGLVTMLSISFEVPVAVRIQAVKAWINGSETASFALNTFNNEWATPLISSFQVEPVLDAPAKWQGVTSLKWDLQPGTYTLYINAPDVPFGYGYNGPIPDTTPLLLPYGRFRDYSDPDNLYPPPMGLEVYGTQLSAVPEPSFYGLIGGTGLFALAAYRRSRREVRSGQSETVNNQ